jgi:hypothetical protein
MNTTTYNALLIVLGGGLVLLASSFPVEPLISLFIAAFGCVLMIASTMVLLLTSFFKKGK